MKRIFKTLALLLIAFVCGFSSGIYRSNAALPDTLHADSRSAGENNNAYFVVSSLINTFHSENIVTGSTPVPAPYLKNNCNIQNAIAKATELLFIHQSSYYLVYSENITPGFPPTDITFPFNYFW